MAKRKPPTVSRLKVKLWDIFAEYVKLKASKDGKTCLCYTCDKVLILGTINAQAGHWLPKGAYGYHYFNEDNIRPQCSGCNLFLQGNTEEFRQRLVAELGQDVVEKMHQDRRIISQRKRSWYLENIEIYTDKRDKLKRLLGL